MEMTKEQIEARLGCPIEKLPLGVNAGKIAVDCDGHKGTFLVLRVVIEDGYRATIEFWVGTPSGRVKKFYVYTGDYGLTWAASEEDWPFAKAYRDRKGEERK